MKLMKTINLDQIYYKKIFESTDFEVDINFFKNRSY